jgi:hypothetical protein
MPEKKEEIKVEDVLGFVDIKGESLDELKTAFNEKYTPTEKFDSEIGALNGKLSTAFKKNFRDIVEVDAEELKDKTNVEVFEIYSNKITETLNDLEKNKKLTNDQLEEQYKTDIEKYKTQLNENKELLTSVQTQFSDYKSQVATEKKTFKVTSLQDQAKSQLSFSEQSSKFEKDGFFSNVHSNYAFDIDDDGNQRVHDKDGKLVQSDEKAGTPATFLEIYKKEFKDSGLDKKTDSKKFSKFATTSTNSNDKTGKNGRTLAARH